MGRLYDAYVEVGPRFTGFGDIKKQGDRAGKEYGKALADAAVKAAQANVRKLGEALATARGKEADAAGKVRVAETKLNEVRANARATATQVAAAEEALAAAQRKSAKAADVAATAAQDLDKARDKVAKAAEATGKDGGNRFTSGFRGALSKFKPDMQGKQVMTRFGVGLNGAIGSVVSRSAGIFAAGFAAVKVGGLAKEAVNLEATFSQTMNTMAAVAKVPADQIKTLSDLAIKMGADTTFSASEAAGAMLELAKGGLSAATIQSGALEGTLTLAAAGGTDLATASTIASNALNTFGLAGKDMASVAAALAGGANASSASVESLGEALGQVGPGATNAGLSLQDTVGVLSSFDAAGIKGSDAGTSLKTMLTRLVPSTTAASTAMKDLGLKFTDANGAFVPITNVAQQLKDKLSGLSDEQRTAALSTIFGSDATRAATVLMKEGAAGIGKYISATKDQGAAQAVASARMKGTAGALESFKGSVETAKLQLGLFLAPAIQGGLGLLTKMLNGIAPAAARLAPTFSTLKTGILAFGQAFKGEGITSDGFVGAMERIGVAARAAFGFFKTEVLPRLREFGGFLVGTVVPAIAAFGQRLVTELGPTVKDVFGFFKTEVIPRLQEFASFLGDKVLPPVQQFADKVLASKDFLVPFIGVILGVGVALKAWAVAQGILNVVMSANPIGLVVIAVAALVAGIVYAYKHSEKFRDIIQGAFHGIQTAAQVMAPLVKAAIDIIIGVFSLWWNYYAKPILNLFKIAVEETWKKVQLFATIVAAGFNAIKAPAKAALGFVINQFLGFVGNILNAAAKAFGWVPNLGPKLKAAAKEFGKFRDNVNAALNGVKDQTITVTAKLNAANIKNKNANDPRLAKAYASGGAVFGSGSGTSDSIPAMLSNGEHVWTAKEVQKAGGHSAVQSMRKSVLAYAKGGPVGFDVEARTGNPTRFANQMAAAATTAVRPAAQLLANSLSAFSPGLNAVLNFVKSQVGKPYVWGGVGPGGYDCSGLVSAAINVAFGRNPHSRLGATGSMPWSMFASGPGAFEVGWFKGNPGHTAATVNGVNIESSGGRGVHMGTGARGARNSLFTNRAHVKGFAKGGAVQGDLPFDLLDPQGKRFLGTGVLKQLGIEGFAKGAWEIARDQLALIHEGEMVLPAGMAKRVRGRYLPLPARPSRHQLHLKHVAHTAHMGHVRHNAMSQMVTSDPGLRLHPDSVNDVAIAVAGAVQANPPQVMLDGRKVSLEMARSALGRGY